MRACVRGEERVGVEDEDEDLFIPARTPPRAPFTDPGKRKRDMMLKDMVHGFIMQNIMCGIPCAGYHQTETSGFGHKNG